MELKNLDEEYASDKKAYEKLAADKATLKKLKLAAYDASNDYKKLLSENERAKVAGDRPPHDKKELETAKKKADDAVKDLKKFEDKTKAALDKVNSRYEELAKDPEMKAHLDSILKVRMERSIKREQANLDRYQEIKEIFDKHPSAQKLAQGLINNRRQIRRLPAKIQELEAKTNRTPDEDSKLAEYKTELAEAKNKEIARKADLEVFLKKQYPDISKETKELLLGLDKTVDKSIKAVKNDIDNRKRAYKKVAGKEFKEEQTQGRTESGEKTGKNLPVKQSRWQKFKNWVKNAWNGNKDKDKEEVNSSKQDKAERKSSEFRNSYKYEVVQDYVQKQEEDLLKTSSKQRRAEAKKDKDENER